MSQVVWDLLLSLCDVTDPFYYTNAQRARSRSLPDTKHMLHQVKSAAERRH